MPFPDGGEFVIAYDADLSQVGSFCDPASFDESMYEDGSAADIDVTCSVFDPAVVPVSAVANPSCTFTISFVPGALQPQLLNPASLPASSSGGDGSAPALAPAGLGPSHAGKCQCGECGEYPNRMCCLVVGGSLEPRTAGVVVL